MAQSAGVNGPRGATRGDRLVRTGAVVAACVLQLVVLVPFTVSSGLLAPRWAVVALHLLWVAAVVVLVAVARRRPLFTPLVPVTNTLLWWAGISAGGAWLGWTA